MPTSPFDTHNKLQQKTKLGPRHITPRRTPTTTQSGILQLRESIQMDMVVEDKFPPLEGIIPLKDEIMPLQRVFAWTVN